MKGIVIRLTPHNVRFAGYVGVERAVMDINYSGRYGINNAKSGWQASLMGACGEVAVAKWLGVYYDGALGNFKAADVGEFQVRTNSWLNGDLILHPADKDDEKFILVLAHNPPAYTIYGWAYGREGKKPEFYRQLVEGRPKVYCPPQRILRPMDTLRNEGSFDFLNEPEEDIYEPDRFQEGE